jgi:Flp pilus assembly protein TadG
MRRSVETLWRNVDGAVAPIVALSLIALVAAGGIAFDYARVASMDTELQDAADQAALAAASQLDRQSGACVRAAAAAATLLTNNTLFANEGNGMAVVVPTGSVTDCTGNSSIQFYQTWNQDTDLPGLAATADTNARYVVVSVTPREAVYALTPIVAAFHSPNIGAQAVASLDSAICKMPPVMICNPSETSTNTSFDPSAYIGDGIRLTSVGNGSGTWAPGNFGYLDTQTGVNGAPDLREGLGWNTPPGECVDADGVNTKPGATVTVTDALNTRFDIYGSNVACPTGGSCSASINSRKDVRRPANANTNQGCGVGPQGWQLDTSGNGYYGQTYPTTVADLPTATTPSSMGTPRDECHAISANGSCTGGRIGDGAWDRNAYFRTNYVRSDGTYWTSGAGVGSWQANTGLSATATRYQVYAWEEANRGTAIDGVTVLGQRPTSASGNTLVSYPSPVCSAAQGYGTGQIPGPTTPDRRRISVAVVNCMANNVKGDSTNVPVEKWIDVFLVEPSLNRARTNNGDMYVEVIGETKNAGQNASAVIVHQVPYLIK